MEIDGNSNLSGIESGAFSGATIKKLIIKELKEEILSNLNDHFEAHLSEGMSETQAYTESIKDLGDVDLMLKGVMPNRDIQEKIESFNKIYARNTAVSVVLYILSVVFLIGMACLPQLTGKFDEGKAKFVINHPKEMLNYLK